MPEASGSAAPGYTLGVISDTHGLLRPQALAALASAQHILHAGDVGDIAILDALRKVAPVTAVRGNIDTSGPCADLPATELVEVAGRFIYMVHSINELDVKPSAAGIAAVVYGHSHRAAVSTQEGVLYLNPGSAGPRRFQLPVTVALVTISQGGLAPRIVPLL